MASSLMTAAEVIQKAKEVPEDDCLFCTKSLGLQEETYLVQVQMVKNARWSRVAVACSECVDDKGYKLRYRYYGGVS